MMSVEAMRWFFGWMADNPAVGLPFLLAALAWTYAYMRREPGPTTGFVSWMQRLIGGGAFLFGILFFSGLLRVEISSAAETSREVFQQDTQVRLEGEIARWGGGFLQEELRVKQYEWVEEQEIIQSADQAGPARIVTRSFWREVPQNGILETNGYVRITRSYPERRARGERLFNSFFVSADFAYVVVNTSASPTQAEFLFPLSPRAEVYDRLMVWLDGRELDSELQIVEREGIAWKIAMQPGQKVNVRVEYASRGVDWYFYRIPQAREMGLFQFEIETDTAEADFRSTGNSSAIGGFWKKDADTGNWIAEWWKYRGDKAILSPDFGLWFKAGEEIYQPYWRFPPVLESMPDAAVWFLLMSVLTLILSGYFVAIPLALLLASLPLVETLLLAGLGSLSVPFYASYAAAAAAAAGLLFCALPRIPGRVVRIFVLFHFGLFAVGYPLVSLTPELRDRNTIYGIFHTGVILYLFFFSLIPTIRNRIRRGVPVNTSPA
jgi:hypothetical protein